MKNNRMKVIILIIRRSGKLRPKIEEVPETLGELGKRTLGRGKSKYRSPEAGRHLACSGS